MVSGVNLRGILVAPEDDAVTVAVINADGRFSQALDALVSSFVIGQTFPLAAQSKEFSSFQKLLGRHAITGDAGGCAELTKGAGFPLTCKNNAQCNSSGFGFHALKKLGQFVLMRIWHGLQPYDPPARLGVSIGALVPLNFLSHGISKLIGRTVCVVICRLSKSPSRTG